MEFVIELLIFIIALLIITGIIFMIALGLVQIIGIDRDRMHYRTGRLTLPTRKQVKYAFISTIGLLIVIAIFLFLTK